MEEFWDIKDEESLRVWLESQPQRYSVVIAHRVAMRMLPVYWGHVVPANEFRESDLDIMPILRASLLSGAGAYSPEIEGNPDLIQAATLAAFRAPSNLTLTHTADDGVISVVSSPLIPVIVKSAENSAYAAAYSASAPTLIQAADAAAVAAHAAMVSIEIWGLINKDCSLLVDGENLSYWTLWAEGLNFFRPEWAAIKVALAKDDIDWSFWIKWYEAALSGTPLPLALLERVALEVKEEDWEQGPQHVNGMIAEIEAEFVADALPQADRMDVDPDTGLVGITPILTTEEAIVATSLKQVEFSYSVAKSSNCGLNFNSVACLYLEQTFENCGDDPNAILQNYQIAFDDILEGLKNGAYLDDAKLTALSAVLEKEIVNLLANHPEVKKADRARIAYALSLAKSDVKLKIVEELEFAKAAVGLRLDAEMSLDSKLVAEEAESPAQAKAAQRLFGRIAQMYVTMKNASTAVVKKIDAATGYRFARIVMTLGKIVGWITSLFS